jgi:hypothetical protein
MKITVSVLVILMAIFSACQAQKPKRAEKKSPVPPEAEISGRVIDARTRAPIRDSRITTTIVDEHLYIPYDSALTGGDGRFAIGLPVFRSYTHVLLGVRKEEYGERYFNFDYTAQPAREFGDVEMQYELFGWPVPDSFFQKPGIASYRDPYLSELSQYDIAPKRTVRLPGNLYDGIGYMGPLARFPDSVGGEWVVFSMSADMHHNFVFFVTYVNPDGSLERSCPIGGRPVSSLLTHLKGDGIEIGYGIMEDGRQQTRTVSISIADLRADSDSDALPDKYEELYCLNPRNHDTDGDGPDDLNDPFPNVAATKSSNDTVAVLQACFQDWMFLPNPGIHAFGDVTHEFPDSSRVWLMAQIFDVGDSNRYRQPNFNIDFEKVLLSMTPAEMRRLYPRLKEVNRRGRVGGGSIEQHSGKYIDLLYLERLKNADEENIEIIRREIARSYFTYFLAPVKIEGDVARYGIFPPDVSKAIYIADSDDRHDDKYLYTYTLGINQMDSTSAVVVSDQMDRRLAFLYIKRDGGWHRVATKNY